MVDTREYWSEKWLGLSGWVVVRGGFELASYAGGARLLLFTVDDDDDENESDAVNDKYGA